MMVLRSEDLRPELPESASFPSSFGAPLDVAAGAATTLVDLTVLVTEEPPVTKTMVVSITWVMLLAGLVEAGDTGPEVVGGACEEEIVSVALGISAEVEVCDSASASSLDVKVDEGSLSSVGDVDVDTGSGLLDVARDDSGVSLAGIGEIVLLEASEDTTIEEADV